MPWSESAGHTWRLAEARAGRHEALKPLSAQELSDRPLLLLGIRGEAQLAPPLPGAVRAVGTLRGVDG
eukprot:3647386-Prymnesium_polylepis.1